MMRQVCKKAVMTLALLLLMGLWPMAVQAAEDITIKDGVFAGDIALGGMTEKEAKAAIENYVASLQGIEITFEAADEHTIVVTAGDLGLRWANTQIAEEALQLGREGNVVQRYKAIKDLEHENRIYTIEFEFDKELITEAVNKGTKYDVEAVNVSLLRKDGVFSVVDGQTGYVLNVEASVNTVYSYLTTEWNHQICSIPMDIEVDEPLGSPEELLAVKDVLGSFTTSYSTSGPARTANVVNGCNLINGTTLYPGEEFSTYEEVSPFSEANGYYMAGSYLNGKVVDSLGGGICQVSTTLYNTVLLSELEVTERHNHSMIVSYVDPSADAAIAESSGKDFRFVNNTEYPIYIEGYTSTDKKITFNIYGVETRSDSHTVKYESEVIEETHPEVENIYTDAGQPIGYIATTGAHIGYKAKLWKVVYENGVEISREQINSSTYKMSPRSATVGVATADPNAYNEIMAAIGTGSIDHVKNVIAILVATPVTPEVPAEESAN